MSMNNAIIRIAKNKAELSQHRFRIGAVVHHGNTIVASGYNKANKTHPRSPHPFKSIHAEFDAVIHALYETRHSNLRGFSIYVHRLKRDGSDGLAKPCVYCQFMLSQVGIEKINYSVGT